MPNQDSLRRLADGRRSPQVFLSHAKLMLKRQYLQEAALAVGGWDRLTPTDLERVGGQLRAQYGRLATMTLRIRLRMKRAERRDYNTIH